MLRLVSVSVEALENLKNLITFKHEKKENWYQSNLHVAFAAGLPFKARPAASLEQSSPFNMQGAILDIIPYRLCLLGYLCLLAPT